MPPKFKLLSIVACTAGLDKKLGGGVTVAGGVFTLAAGVTSFLIEGEPIEGGRATVGTTGAATGFGIGDILPKNDWLTAIFI